MILGLMFLARVRRRFPLGLSAFVLGLGLFSGGEAFGQGVAVGRPRISVEELAAGRAEEPGDKSRAFTLRSAMGVPVAERLLLSGSADDRLRGVLRLGAIGTPEAIDALVDTIEQSSIVSRDGRVRLSAMRVLSAHADRENVRPLLLREIADTGPEGRAALAPLGVEVRAAAAFSLGRSGEKKALLSLLAAVLQGGPAADAAAAALIEFPPSSLAPFFEGKRRIEPVFAAFLADLGDVRALEKLRATLDDTDPAYRAAAALALAKLGDASGTNLARTWVRSDDTRLQRVGAEVLMRVSAPGATDAVALLLLANATRMEGVRLAALAPSPALIKPLVASLSSLPEGERDKAIALLGRAGGTEAASALLVELGKPERATAAAFALARMAGKEGRLALEAALASDSAKAGAPRRLMVRASLLRALAQDDEPSGLGRVLDAMAKDKEPADRSVSLFGRVATKRTSVRDALSEACTSGKTCDVVLVAAVARAALWLGADALSLLLPILKQASFSASPSALTVAAGVALLADPKAEGVSSSLLLSWAEGGGPLAPLAARALPSRDDEALRGRIKRLLRGTDPVIRSHVALGLALDPEPDAVSLLVSAYAFEEDVTVRRAVVRALSGRKEPQRTATLKLARDLDSDGEVRALARAALSGRVLLPELRVSGAEVVWASLVANAPSAMDEVKSRQARLVRSDGLALPVVADPDGVLLVPGLPSGRSLLTLALEGNPRDNAKP